MPNTYCRPRNARKYAPFCQEDLDKAIKDVADGTLRIRAAAEKYSISKSTIHRKYHGANIKKYGGQTVFSTKDEMHIAYGLLLAAKWGFPFTHMDLKQIVKQFLDRKGVVIKIFKNNLPGRIWLKGFLNRHKRLLSNRFSENIKRARAMVSAQTINAYFDNLEVTLANVPPENIINFDETNMCDDPGQQTIIVRRGAKHAERIIDATKSSTSVMFSIAGDGTLLPLHIVYKSKHVYDTWTENGPEGAIYDCSKSGWFDGVLFEKWFTNVAFEYLRRRDGVKVLIGDNLASHVSISVIEKCDKNNIRFVLLPPNSTHLTQPLDVAFFRPLKQAWRKNLLDWKKRNRGTLPKSMFPAQLNQTLISLENSKTNAISGFRACGIIPFDRNQVLKRLPDSKTEDNKEVWSAAFEETLRSAREAQPTRQRRNKKNKVPAGQSITIRTLANEDEELMDIDNPERQELLSESDQENEPNEIQSETNLIEQAATNSSPQVVLLNSFVLCDFVYNKDTKKEIIKKFIVKVLDFKDDEKYQVSCMRYSDLYHCYVFPNVEDITIIKKDQIKEVLPEPRIKRGRYTFSTIEKFLH